MKEIPTGQRVARARRRKGWTQAQLAAAVGRSASWVAKVEGGHAALDRMSVLVRIANALGVEPVELTGQPYRPETPAMDSGHAGVPPLRLALQRASMPDLAVIDGPTRDLPAIRAQVERAEELRQAARVGTGAGSDHGGLLLHPPFGNHDIGRPVSAHPPQPV